MPMPGAGWCWQQCPWQEHLSQAGRGAVQQRGGVLALLVLLQAGHRGCSAGRSRELGWGAREAEPSHPAAPLPLARAD